MPSLRLALALVCALAGEG